MSGDMIVRLSTGVITSWAGGRVFERRARMCRPNFMQCGCVPGVCARDLVSDCQALIRQCNEAMFSVGEDTGGAGAGRQEGAVPQRQEAWRHGGVDGLGLNGARAQTAYRCTCWTFHCISLHFLAFPFVSFARACDKGWLFKSEFLTPC